MQGDIFDIYRISMTRISVQKRLNIVVKLIIFFQKKMKHLFGAEIRVAEMRRASKISPFNCWTWPFSHHCVRLVYIGDMTEQILQGFMDICGSAHALALTALVP